MGIRFRNEDIEKLLAGGNAKAVGVNLDAINAGMVAKVEGIQEPEKPQRKSKYGNKHVKLDGFTFDSIAEAKRYGELKLMAQAGAIRDLQVHKKFDLVVRGVVLPSYEADFVYTTASGEMVVEGVS